MMKSYKYMVAGIWMLTLSLFISILPISAKTILTDCDEVSLTALLVAGGDIQLNMEDDCEIIFTDTVRIAVDTTIENSGTTTVTFNGANTVRLFDVINSSADFTLKNLILSNGISVNDDTLENSGGAIENYGTLTISNSTFIGNVASFGGAIFNTGGDVIITDSTFTENSAQSGAAIASVGGTITITNSTFTQNQSEAFGAVLIAQDTDILIEDSVLSDNEAIISAGAIFNDNSRITIRGSVLVNNRTITNSNSIGGAIFNYAGETTVINSTFAQNVSDAGSAIAVAGGIVTITHSTFVENISVARGDTFYQTAILFDEPIQAGEMTITASIITDGACVIEGDALITDGGNNIVFNALDCAGKDIDPEFTTPMDGVYIPQATTLEYPPACLEETDQLGNSRPVGSGCTIGAIELDNDGQAILPETIPVP